MKDTKWYAKSLEEVAAKTDIVNGLTDAQIEASREKYGMNKLAEAKGRSFMMRLLDQFKDVTIIILLVAALISGIVGEHADAILIFAIVALNALIGMIQEDKVSRSLLKRFKICLLQPQK